ncbi:AraC family transcriptional regulator [Paenibacillus lentus]|uniref:AraC family transcriptional regulator n=1 Tax=Paenibacillus lentus TaxID=1338368 RepID=UPI0013DDBDF5|nr:AraC family transcriptional regulator [Paenibacillus lentus]
MTCIYKLNKIRTNGQLYVKLLLAITLCIVVSIFVSSFIYYFTFMRILQNEAFESDLANLRQTGKTVANTTENAQTVAFQIYRNNAISKLLYYNTPNPFDTQAAMLDLNNYLVTMPYIHSIYVYNPLSETYYIASRNGQKGIIHESELQDQDMIQILSNYGQYKPFTPIPRYMHANKETEEIVSIYTYLCYDAIGFNRTINSAVIVNISASWINQGLVGQQDKDKSRTFLIDDRQAILSAEDLTPVMLSASELQLIERLVLNKDSGYTVDRFDHSKSLITYTAPNQYNWHYVRITPYSEITMKLRNMKLKTLLIACLVVTIGVFLAWLVSRFLYVPIHKIESQMKYLESEKRDSSYTLRQNTLRKLIQIQDFNVQAQTGKLRSMGISFDFTKPYRLAYLRIDRFKQLKEEQHNDLLTYKFAIMNIATEICSRQYTVDSIDLEDDSILMLINTFEEFPSPFETHEMMLRDIQNACMEYIRIGLTIVLTPVTENPHDLHAMFKLVKEATSQRFFKGLGSIIEAVPLMSNNKYSFPLGKEKRMLEALAGGKMEEAKALFDEIMQGTVGYSYPVAHGAASHLSVTLDNMLTEIERNSSMQLGLGADFTIPRMDQYETLVELTEAFHTFFDLLNSKLIAKRNGKHEELIHRINDMIEAYYHDPNFSLNYLADELNLSTYHISRVYRQHTLSTIVEMINHTRIKNAKALLTSSRLPISEIAARTGYTNSSYFYRMFKKVTGVTPSEYRNANPPTAE